MPLDLVKAVQPSLRKVYLSPAWCLASSASLADQMPASAEKLFLRVIPKLLPSASRKAGCLPCALIQFRLSGLAFLF